MVRAPRRFVQETLWPEFQELSCVLSTERVVAQVHPDSSEAAEVAAPRRLAAGGGD